MEITIMSGQMERRLVLLRPNQYNDGDLRLALFTEDFARDIRGEEINALYVNLGGSNYKIDSIRTYKGFGSIVNKRIISKWLQDKGFNVGTLLLFEFLMNKKAGAHLYRFLGSADEIRNLISSAEDKQQNSIG